MQNTIEDFWHMVTEQDIKVVIQLELSTSKASYVVKGILLIKTDLGLLVGNNQFGLET